MSGPPQDLVVFSVTGLIAVAVTANAWQHRRDRAAGRTLGVLAGAGFAWFWVLAALGWDSLAACVLLAVVGGAPAAALVIWSRRRLERTRGRDSALVAGFSAQDTARAYRATPAHPYAVLLYWCAAALIWVFAFATVMFVAGLPHSLLESPAWAPPGSPNASPDAELPWWIWVLGGFTLGGVIHMVTNAARRGWF